MKKAIILAMTFGILSSVSYAIVANKNTTGTVKEIVGLKCPNHDYVKDNHNFMYKSVGGNQATNATRCLRCGFTKSLHKVQK